MYPPCAEPEARNSAVGWHWNTHILHVVFNQGHVITKFKDITRLVMISEDKIGVTSCNEVLIRHLKKK